MNEMVVDQAPSETARALRPRRSFDQVPALGYRNYWYPALQSKELRRKPLRRKLLGDDIVFFRERETQTAYAMADRCPHRNASLAQGKAYYPGTLTCSYHGWTFNTKGELVAVLSEGPHCPLVGQVQQRVYPVEEFRDLVWIWMGEGKPVPLTDDLPTELVDPSSSLFLDVQIWKANWRIVTENTDGYHAPILHVASMPRTLYMNWVAWRRTSYTHMDDGRGLIFFETESRDEAEYPDLGHWPQVPWSKRLAKKLLRAKTARGRVIDLPNGQKGRITEDVHLPGWRRVRVRVQTVFVEWAVPIDENNTCHMLWDVVLKDKNAGPIRQAISAFRLLFFKYVIYPTYWRWAYNHRYVGQDKAVLETMYNGDEYLQANDAGILAWRKLSTRARGVDEAQQLNR